MKPRWIAIAAALAAAAPATALACGACDEDKIAATYDHAVIDAAIARHRQVVFVAIDGPVDVQRIRARIVAAAAKVQASGPTRFARRWLPSPFRSHSTRHRHQTPRWRDSARRSMILVPG
jgi:hypothetical protein